MRAAAKSRVFAGEESEDEVSGHSSLGFMYPGFRDLGFRVQGLGFRV